MAYKVGEVARLAHVSVRTLHHYDKTGLLEPSARSAAGYRLYTTRDLERLQHVVFYRELGFGLEKIHPGMARYLRDAIVANAARTLADPG
jgi:DNA-binding transcriptional MerR regulator